MVYIDTNIIVALCVKEPNSDRVANALRAIEAPLLTSEWTRVEFTSAIGIKFRNRELAENLARQVLADYYEATSIGARALIQTGAL